MAKFTYDHIHLRSPDPEATARYYETHVRRRGDPDHAGRQAAH
jgi:hypothetical protein